VIPQKYLIATLFIAAMLLLVAIGVGFRPPGEGGVTSGGPVAITMVMDSFEAVADWPLEDGWSPRFIGAHDPDQREPWPFEGAFGAPWEPASPYLADQGLALNGPQGTSMVALWRGLEWRRYRFDAPLASARLAPGRANRLLVTLALGPARFETRLLEIPEGRVLWSLQSSAWSRFSWDGRAALVGLADPKRPERLLLSVLPLDPDLPEPSLAPWNEDGLPAPPRGWPASQDALWDDARDLPGAKVLLPWSPEGAFWLPRQDRLWTCAGQQWTAWRLARGIWERAATGDGQVFAHPPGAMGRIGGSAVELRALEPPEAAPRFLSSVDAPAWRHVPPEAPSWPAYDPAWAWRGDADALTAWDLRWGPGTDALAPERQREALVRAFRPEWKTSLKLRASVGGWLPHGPEVALRESDGSAWVWVGNRVLLVRLTDSERTRRLRALLK